MSEAVEAVAAPDDDVHEQVAALVQRLVSSGDQAGAAVVVTLEILNDPDWQRGLRLVQMLEQLGELQLAEEAVAMLERRWYTRGNPHALTWTRFYRARIRAKSAPPAEAVRALEGALATDGLPPGPRAMLWLLLLDHFDMRGESDELQLRLERMIEEGVSDAHVVQRALYMATTHELESVVEKLTAEAVPTAHVEPVATFPGHRLPLGLPDDGRYPHHFAPYVGIESRDVDPLPVYVLEDVVLVARERGYYIFDNEGHFVAECSSNAAAPTVGAAAEALDAAGDIPMVDGTCALIADLFVDHNYSHWLFDWLARIPICETAGVPLDKVVGYELATDFERESLEFVGFGVDRFLGLAEQPVLKFERLVVPSTWTLGLLHPAHLGDPLLLRWWRDLASRQVKRRRAAASRRIYLPRIGKRAVLNQTAVVELLEEHGFHSYDTGRLSFREQIELFSTASAVVAPHGAAVTNILFAPESCRVLELFGPTGGTAAYLVVAKSLGMPYSLFVSKMPQGEVSGNFDDLPIEVDLDFLQGWLDELPPLRKKR